MEPQVEPSNELKKLWSFNISQFLVLRDPWLFVTFFFLGEFFQQHIQNDLKREVKNGEPAIQRRNLKNVTTAHHKDFESENDNKTWNITFIFALDSRVFGSNFFLKHWKDVN